jgi:hypothetical protein
MGVLDPINYIRRPEEFLGRRYFYGLYRGTVESVEDPEYRGRIKARVQGVHDPDPNKVPTMTLPWATPNAPPGAGDGYGQFNVPYNIGDTVFVLFVGGRKRDIVYIGSWWGMSLPTKYTQPETPAEAWQQHDKNDNNLETPKPYLTGYPRRQVNKTAHGHVIEISDETLDLEIVLRTAGGQKIWLRESPQATGKGQPRGIEIKDSTGNLVQLDEETGTVSVEALGNVEINGAVQVLVNGGSVKVEGSDVEIESATMIELKGNGGTSPTGGVVVAGPNGTICPFTGLPHYDGSTNVKATKT